MNENLVELTQCILIALENEVLNQREQYTNANGKWAEKLQMLATFNKKLDEYVPDSN